MAACRNLLRRDNLLFLEVLSRSYSTQGKNVAFIGLGNMGNHMAGNLVKKGFKVKGYDTSPEAVKFATTLGVEAGKSIESIVEGADAVISILPSNEIVTEVFLGDKGVLSKASKDAILIDSSTVEPHIPKHIYEKAKQKGLAFIDAPVSGGVVGAEKATLSFLIGGEEASFNKAKPFLSAMGAKLYHCGPIGAGEVTKICNNFLLAITMIGTAESMNLAIRNGLDPKTFLQVLNTSTGRSWSSEVNCPVPGIVDTVPSSRDYNGGFKTSLITKDLQFSAKLASNSRSPTPLGGLAAQIYQILTSKGFGEKDFSYVYQFLKEGESQN